MIYHVNVVFGKDREYTYTFSDSELAGRSAEEARRWFDREFNELDCPQTNPVGKVLVIDKILNVARVAGEQRFNEGKVWTHEFAYFAALALGRDTITVDVPGMSINY
ncbi:MAG: hypothetical protein FWD77_09995 [Betaproteobacteria bacterium]|nr:hypothetical protein [Betaproteobacteria bacterium]